MNIVSFYLLFYSNSLKIARKADNKIGNRDWAFSSKRRTGLNTDKDYIFVAEVVEWAGGSVPHKYVSVCKVSNSLRYVYTAM